MIAYKYRGGFNFERDLKSIEESFFWASDIESLNDPCEATFIDNVGQELNQAREQLNRVINLFGSKNNNLDKKSFEELIIQFENITKLTNKMGVFSLSKDYKNDLLWAHYSDSHKGFTVGYDIDILREFNYTKHYILDIIYAEEPGAFGLDDILHLSSRGIIPFLQKLIGTKTNTWAYECETRIITDDFGKQFYDFRAVKSIYFGLRMPRFQVEETMRRLQGRNIEYYTMIKSKNKFKLEAISEPDKYINSPPYLYSISPVQEDPVSPQDLKEEYKAFAPYLYKAVEVHRRDPYCAEVCYCTFSVTKSTLEDPIAFVHYITTSNLYINKFYTLNEIDKLYNAINDL